MLLPRGRKLDQRRYPAERLDGGLRVPRRVLEAPDAGGNDAPDEIRAVANRVLVRGDREADRGHAHLPERQHLRPDAAKRESDRDVGRAPEDRVDLPLRERRHLRLGVHVDEPERVTPETIRRNHRRPHLGGVPVAGGHTERPPLQVTGGADPGLLQRDQGEGRRADHGGDRPDRNAARHAQHQREAIHEAERVRLRADCLNGDGGAPTLEQLHLDAVAVKVPACHCQGERRLDATPVPVHPESGLVTRHRGTGQHDEHECQRIEA